MLQPDTFKEPITSKSCNELLLKAVNMAFAASYGSQDTVDWQVVALKVGSLIAAACKHIFLG